MIAVLLCSALIATATAHPGCIHDRIIKNQKLIPIDDSTMHRGRDLQSAEYGPIRLHFIYNNLEIDPKTANGQNIIKMMEILKIFWQKTLEVYYAPALSFNVVRGMDPNAVNCLGFVVPLEVIRNPVPNADFGFLIEAKDDGDSGTTAYSYPCAYSETNKKPMWGLLHWNINYFSFDLLSFQMNIKIGIHEATHLLGFSSILYDNFVHGKVIKKSQGVYMNGSFIQKAIKDQYGCDSAPGMPIETGGGQGTANSHWSYKTAFNQYMTAGVLINNPTISFITLALLEETGWYKSVSKNYGEFINFGFKKGCSVLNPSNCSSNEYCTKQAERVCDYDQTAFGHCKNDTLSNCLSVRFYLNTICADPNYHTKSINALLINVTGEEGGQYSRCFSSNLVLQGSQQTKYPFRCYSAVCSPSGRTLTIKVGTRYGLCMFPGQNITVSGYSGYLLCPTSFSRTCAVKRCPDECNGNGVCLNGKCLCSPSYSGEACSQVTSIGFASRRSQSLFFAKSNAYCLLGSYLSEFGECEPCGPLCAQCDQQGCKACVDGKELGLDQQCV